MKFKHLLPLSVTALAILPATSYSALLQGDSIYISFDNSSDNFTDGSDTWNRLTFTSTQRDAANGGGVGPVDGTPQVLESDFVNTANVSTDIGFTMVNPMNFISNAGVTSGTNWPDAAAVDYWYGDDNTHNSTFEDGLGIFQITGLDQGLSYSFDIFASRAVSNETRETDYTLTGANSGSATLDVANNADNSVVISGITPDSNGTISLRLESGDTNDSGPDYYYINAMKITAIPEPSSLALILGSLSMLAVFTARRRK